MENEKLFSTDCIRTYTGKYLDVFNPDPEQICIEDIAHALANQCRFSGHTRTFYSVVQHSVMVARRVPDRFKLQALMHDASEAYMLDIPTPIKLKLPDYMVAEKNLMHCIATKFGFSWPMHACVNEADKLELQSDWHYLMDYNPGHIDCWKPDDAEHEFLYLFRKYSDFKCYGRR